MRGIMSNKQPNKAVASAVAAALSIPAMTFQDSLAQESNNAALEEIIVTATKRELNLAGRWSSDHGSID